MEVRSWAVPLKVAIPLALAAVLGASCRTAAPVSGWDYGVSGTAFEQDAPSPAGEALQAAPEVSRISEDEVNLDPAASEGYENLPERDRNLYDQTVQRVAIRDVIEQTLANNRQIQIQKYTLDIAEAEVAVSKSIYDLFLSASAGISRIEQQTATTLSASDRRERGGSVVLSQLLPSGASASISYDYNRLNQVFAFSAINPAITQALTLALIQPIWRGFGPTITNLDIHIAQLGQQASAADFEAQLQDQLAQSLDAYWDLVLVVQLYDVELIAYLSALELLRVNRAKEAVGVMSPTEVLQAQATAEERRERVIRARQAVRDAEDVLKLLMFLREGSPNWLIQPSPAQELTWRVIEIDAARVMAEAVTQRPELRALESRLQQREREIVRAMDILNPALDLVGTFGITGLGDNDGDSYDALEDADFDNYRLGFEFSVPLQNRAARYRLQQNRSAKEQSLELYLAQRDIVEFEIRNAIRSLETDLERIDVSRSRVVSERANLEAERRRLEVGDSTDFQVLEFQEDLAEAMGSHVLAIVDYNKSAIALERARGTLMQTYGVVLDSPDLRPEPAQVLFPIHPNDPPPHEEGTSRVDVPPPHVR